MKTQLYFNVVTILKDGTVLAANFDNQKTAQDTMNFYIKQGNIASQSYSFYEVPVIETPQEFHDSFNNKDNVAVKIIPVAIEAVPIISEEIIP